MSTEIRLEVVVVILARSEGAKIPTCSGRVNWQQSCINGYAVISVINTTKEFYYFHEKEFNQEALEQANTQTQQRELNQGVFCIIAEARDEILMKRFPTD